MRKKNLELKFSLMEKFSTIKKASSAIGIDYGRLSQLINGWILPRPSERLKLIKSGIAPDLITSHLEK